MALTLTSNACMPVANWPALDQILWEKAIRTRHGPFRKNGSGRAARPMTIRHVMKGYGRWLTFLQSVGMLDPMQRPVHRATMEALDRYFEDLRDHGNCDVTIIDRFSSLRAALRWFDPAANVSFVTNPHGQSLRTLLPKRRRPEFVPDSGVLLAWAQELFDRGLALHKPRARCAQIREAVQIAILTVRAPRLHTLASMSVGVHLRRVGDEWVLNQTVDITKTSTEIFLPLPTEVGVMIERYMSVERPELLHGQQSDAIWISWNGKKVAESTISQRVRGRTQERFGKAFGPHRFRKSLATTAALRSPDTPLDAQLILGHSSPQVTLAHYNRATAVMASNRHSERIRKLRKA